MKVIFHDDFFQVYTSDPAAAAGRMESVLEVIRPHVELIEGQPASETQVAFVHETAHIDYVRRKGLLPIAALAAGSAIQTATIGLSEPCFGLIRPPGHHASSGSCWGFCYFNNMAVALETLRRQNKIETAYVLDFDLHFGDGTVNILGDRDYVTVYNIGEGPLVCSACIFGTNVEDYTVEIASGSPKTSPGSEMITDVLCNGVNFTVLPGESVVLEVTFQPTSGGTKEAYMLVTSNDPDEPEKEVELHGYGCSSPGCPDILLEPVSWDYGSLTPGNVIDKICSGLKIMWFPLFKFAAISNEIAHINDKIGR